MDRHRAPQSGEHARTIATSAGATPASTPAIAAATASSTVPPGGSVGYRVGAPADGDALGRPVAGLGVGDPVGAAVACEGDREGLGLGIVVVGVAAVGCEVVGELEGHDVVGELEGVDVGADGLGKGERLGAVFVGLEMAREGLRVGLALAAGGPEAGRSYTQLPLLLVAHVEDAWHW